MSVVRYYWDASVFHALFNEEEGRVNACRHIEEMARSGSVDIVTSAITYVECVRLHKEPRKLTPENERTIRHFFELSFLGIENVTRRIGEDARHLLWKYEHLRYPDAIHVATAIHTKADFLLTFDEDDLVRLDGKIGSPPLKICLPPKPPEPKKPEPTLFDLVQKSSGPGGN